MQTARPAERDGMVPRAMEILDKMAFEIESDPDPALTRLLAEVRSEVEGEAGLGGLAFQDLRQRGRASRRWRTAS